MDLDLVRAHQMRASPGGGCGVYGGYVGYRYSGGGGRPVHGRSASLVLLGILVWRR